MARSFLFRSIFMGLLLAGFVNVARADQTIKLVHPLTPAMRAAAEHFFSHDARGIEFVRDGNEDLRFLDQMSGALADIDGDGVDEIFLHFWGFELCGTIGCDVWILKKEGMGWRFFGRFIDYGDDFTILDKTDNGVREIVTYFGGIPDPVVENWDGQQYLPID